jgi:drug/metabolite transporter (DMT)-like permease
MSGATASEKDSLLPTRATTKKVDDVEEEEDKEDKGSALLIAFGMMIVFSLGNRIFGKLVTYPMHNYPMFMNLLSTFVYIPMSFIYIIPAQLFTKNITKEQTDIPKTSFAMMGALDSVSSTMQVFAINYITSASITVLVQQSAIPISMILSKMFLNARYTTPQYTGASIVMGGIVAVLLPTFFTNSGSLPSNQLVWVLAIIVSNVPSVYSSVYKEKALGEVDIDVVYLNGWVAIFQCLIAIPLCIPSGK